MKYTQLPSNCGLEINRIKKEELDLKEAMNNPSEFAHHMLGLTPFKYQHLLLRKFRKDARYSCQRTIICKSRQIGISYCVACLAIWFAMTNQAGTGIHHDTKVGIISRSDDQAKKLMGVIKKLIFDSPQNLDTMVKTSKHDTLSKREIQFQKGYIKCFPPTDACRGETFDLLIVDEAAFVDGELFKDAMEPTVVAVNGKIVLSSTPNGQKGFFFELFDPFDMHPEHEYERFWFHWKMCENEGQRRVIKEKLKHSKITGNVKSFEQEYNALFTVDEEAFFEDQDVENGIDNSLAIEYEWKKTPVVLAIDFGLSQSATCITAIAKTKDGVRLLWQFAQLNFDENLLFKDTYEHNIKALNQRYDVKHIVVDDCAQGSRTNQQLENEGYPLIRFNFRSDQALGVRNRGYYVFRSALKSGKIKYFQSRKLMGEMKSVQEVRMEAYTKIKAPRGYSDDRIDSLMMACYPFLTDDNDFTSILVDYDKVASELQKENKDVRYDDEWGKINDKLPGF